MPLRAKERVRRSHAFWHLVFYSLVLAMLFAVVRGLGNVLTPVAAALVLSYLLDPVVSGLERRLRVPRWFGSLLLFLLVLLAVTLVLLVLVPLLVRELQSFAEAVPVYLQRTRDSIVPWVQNTFNLQVPKSLNTLVNHLGADIRAIATQAAGPLGDVAGQVAGEVAGQVARRTAGVLSAIGTLLLVPIFTFYFLPRFPAILETAESLIPRRHVGWVRETAVEVNAVLASWIRGQVTVAVILSFLYSVGLTIVGIKMAVLIGLVTGFMAFIPYVGVTVGLTFAMIVCMLEYTGPGQVVGVGVVFASVQIMDGLVLTPQIVGDKTGLGPVGVIISLMLGGTLFGFVGVLLAVPTAAALVVVIKRGLTAYRASLYYQKGDERALPGQDCA